MLRLLHGHNSDRKETNMRQKGLSLRRQENAMPPTKTNSLHNPQPSEGKQTFSRTQTVGGSLAVTVAILLLRQGSQAPLKLPRESLLLSVVKLPAVTANTSSAHTTASRGLFFHSFFFLLDSQFQPPTHTPPSIDGPWEYPTCSSLQP